MENNTHIVRFMGGLGNQLFEYALYKTFIEMGFDTYADTSAFNNRKEIRNNQLGYFGVELREAPKKFIKKMYCSPQNTVAKAIIKRCGKRTYYRQRELYYDPLIKAAPCGYFDGYWQSYKYFEDYNEAVLKSIDLRLIASMNKDVKEMESLLSDDNSVSVHVRLGDYLDNPQMYGNICTLHYYEKAMEYLNNEIKNSTGKMAKFYVFSNEIDKARTIIQGDNITFMNGYPEEEGYKDMYLMSRCKHHIMANSSFSWWGSYLGEREDTIVIAPKKWVNGIIAEDIIPERWIAL